MEDLNELKHKKPDNFRYKGKLFKMTYYSIKATHEPTHQISDLIVWKDNQGNEITYKKGVVSE